MTKKHSYPETRQAPTRAAAPHEWSHEEIERLQQLSEYDGGKLSNPQIAKQMTEDFGRPYSRFTINCKLNRLRDPDYDQKYV